MIDIARIDHISMAVPRLEPQIELLERLFGFRFTGRFSSQGFLGADLDIPGNSGIGWELLAPDGPDSYLHRFLDGPNGPGLHHLAMQIRDMDGALRTIRRFGIEPWGLDQAERPPEVEQPAEHEEEGGTHSVAYIHPRGGGFGFLYQFYEGTPWHRSEPFEDDRPNTIGIKAVNSLAHAHHSRGELGDWYEQLFGFRTVHAPLLAYARASFVSLVLELPYAQFGIEVMQPAREDSFLQRFIDERGSAVHHISFEVHDMQTAIAACEFHGVSVIAEQTGQTEGGRWHEAFIPPEHTGGMLVQFFAWESVTPSHPVPEQAVAAPSGDDPDDDVASEGSAPKRS
jgi:4-hydroxyphenylpyruvate dioxygenase-like putative hemolysin